MGQFACDGHARVDTALFKLHAALGEEALDPVARRTVLLREDDDLRLRHLNLPVPIHWAKYAGRDPQRRERASAARGNAEPVTHLIDQEPPTARPLRSIRRRKPSWGRAGPSRPRD